MLVYGLYVFNKKKGYELIWVLPERRKNPARITNNSIMESGQGQKWLCLF
jgi:rRNA maturation protein Rpf1